MRISRSLLTATACVLALGAASVALGQSEFANIPAEEPPITDWTTEPVTSIARDVQSYTRYIAILTLPFLLIPQILLITAIIKFRSRPGRTPSKFYENVALEAFWTIVPVMVLVALAIPSYSLIKKIETMPEPDVSIEIIGHQFFWEYRYPENDVRISDEPLVIPVDQNIVADCTSVDVNHAWWVPAFGVKMDTVPGRTTQIWFNVEHEGWYKGQCAELCGALHSKMLIDVHVVSEEEFDAWIAKKRAELLGGGEDSVETGESAPEAEEAEASGPNA